MVDSKTVFDVIDKDGVTGEIRLPIDFLSLRWSYDRGTCQSCLDPDNNQPGRRTYQAASIDQIATVGQNAFKFFHAKASELVDVAQKLKLGVFSSGACAVGGSARSTKREDRRNNTPHYSSQPTRPRLLGTTYMANCHTCSITPKLLGPQIT